jgi:4-amino-4-deoxy-L-arabinose transferase-like glycosyltransferase
MPDLRACLSEPRNQVLAWMHVVFASLLFLLPSVAKYHGDERFYTDASIRMVQTGDYWTPYFGDGRPRFLKPIVTYWTIAASYQALGINFLASRLPFLVAGCLIIFVTWRVSLTLFRRPPDAALAALIIGSNVQLLTVSIRSTPDVLVSLFLLLSLLGFARIIFGGDRSWPSYALAYVGAGLAVQTKGLLGIASVAFAFLFCLLFKRREIKLRALAEWKAVSLGLGIALFWYAATVKLHGPEVLNSFFADQVSEKVATNPLVPLKNVFVYLGAALRHFLPWTLLLAAGLALNWRAVMDDLRTQRKETLFLGGWFLVMVVIFSFGNMQRTRYLVVSYPLLAVLCARVLARCGEGVRFAGWLRKTVTVLAAVALLIGLLLAGAGCAIHVRMALAGVGVALASMWAYVRARRPAAWNGWLAVAGLSFAVFATAELGLRPLFSRSPARAITAQLLAAGGPGQTVQALNVSLAYQAQVRVFSRGQIHVVPVDVPAGAKIPDLADPVILSEADKVRWSGRDWVLKSAGFASRRWPSKDFLKLLRAETRDAAYARNRIPYYVAFPPRPAP